MSTNIYIFWKETIDPPYPWTRLTRTNKYLRCDSNTANHWSDIGSSTHTHTVSGYSCGSPSIVYTSYDSDAITYAMRSHTHSQPASWTISSANNTPLGYGLDIIYMDMTLWESSYRRFPDGSIILSNGTLTDAGFLSRFTSPDGYYIYHDEPGTIVGSSSSHTHSVSGNTASTSPSGDKLHDWYTGSMGVNSTHSHAISLTSNSTTNNPASIVTRLYEVLALTSKAVSGSVVFVDGSVSANWSILTGWSSANIKSGNSDPTISGSDSHSQTFSGSSSTYNSGFSIPTATAYDYSAVIQNHSHSISGTLVSTSHVPLSKMVVPARLLNTLYAPAACRSRIVGLC